MVSDVDNYTILVVEDNEPINRLFCKNLTVAGFSCHGVMTIDEAITSIQTRQPDLIILDFELPDGYGTRVLDYMQLNNIEIPVIVVSASTLVLQLKHTDYEITDILVKPVSPRHLSSLVTQTLSFLQ